jgi:hypothetical protein
MGLARQYRPIDEPKPMAVERQPQPAVGHVPTKPETVPAQTIAKPCAKRKPGRPLAKDKPSTLAATKPWEALGMSRRTWFYRQREARKN